MSKLTLECVGWKPLRRNTLVGFAEIRVAAMRLTIAFPHPPSGGAA